jgi:hypothetical protein
MRRGDGIMASLAGLALVVVAAAALFGRIEATLAGSIITGVTALIVLWYTLETTRLRRDAEERSARDARPAIYFEVRENDRPDGMPEMLPGGSTPASAQYPLRFWVENVTSNRGIARVRVRLSVAGAVGALQGAGAYDGTRDWEITPFFRLNGVFDLCKLIVAALPASQAPNWPTERMTLAAQMDLYDSVTLRLMWSSSQEYAVIHQPQDGVFIIWREISASVLPQLEVADRLTANATPTRP